MANCNRVTLIGSISQMLVTGRTTVQDSLPESPEDEPHIEDIRAGHAFQNTWIDSLVNNHEDWQRAMNILKINYLNPIDRESELNVFSEKAKQECRDRFTALRNQIEINRAENSLVAALGLEHRKATIAEFRAALQRLNRVKLDFANTVKGCEVSIDALHLEELVWPGGRKPSRAGKNLKPDESRKARYTTSRYR